MCHYPKNFVALVGTRSFMRPHFQRKDAKTQSKVGRAVHCAPAWVVQTRLLGWNPAVRALTGAATSCRVRWCGKNTLLILHPAGRGLPALPAIGF